jgi:hypothetical protein
LKKDLRKQIKQDELVSGVEHGMAWVQGHRREAALTVGLVAVLGVLALSLTYYQKTRQSAADAAFSEALTLFHGDVQGERPPGAPPSAEVVVFPSSGEKFTKAAAAFDGIERRYSSMPIAQRARYYAALCRLEIGQADPARKVLEELAARKDPGRIEPSLARLTLADLKRKSGELEGALEAYRAMADDPGLAIPRDHVLMTLGAALEEARRLPEAASAYRRVSQEFPSSPFAREAEQRAEYLSGESRG